MADQHAMSTTIDQLPPRVLKFLARGTRSRGAETVLEVGSVRPNALADWQSVGVQAMVLTDSAPATPTTPGQVLIGDVAGGMPVAAHSVDSVVLRGARTFSTGLQTPESLLGTANLLSCLKPSGTLLVIGSSVDAIEDWSQQLSRFPVTVQRKDYQDGLGYWLSLQWLRGSSKLQIPVLRAEIGPEAMSRLQWHRLVREMVMKRPVAKAA